MRLYYTNMKPGARTIELKFYISNCMGWELGGGEWGDGNLSPKSIFVYYSKKIGCLISSISNSTL